MTAHLGTRNGSLDGRGKPTAVGRTESDKIGQDPPILAGNDLVEQRLSPLAGRTPAKVAPDVHHQDSRAHKHRSAHHNPRGQIRVNDGVENAH